MSADLREKMTLVTYSLFRLAHWDVNNEMLAHDFYQRVYGSSRIRDDMFLRARARDPGSKLFLNDYNVISNKANHLHVSQD